MNLSPKAQASLNNVVEAFKTGDLSLVTMIARTRLDKSAPSNKWSFSNRVLAYGQAGELDCRTFMQWTDAGRKVKKGSKACFILKPHTIKTTKEVAGKEEPQEERVLIGCNSLPVFAASDTEGNTPLAEYEPVELPPLADVAKKFGIEVEYVPTTFEKLGDCKTDGSKIRLGSQDPRVFFHELTHAIHARLEGGLKGGQQTDQETIAEFTTAVLMDFYGLGDHTGNAWKYISHYSKDPLIAITKAMGVVENVLKILLTG